MVFKLRGIKLWSVVCLTVYCWHKTDGQTVGILLGDYPSQEQRLLNSTISKKYAKEEIIFSANVQPISEIDSFGASETLCEVLSHDRGVMAIFGPKYTTATAILESICLEFEIPYISTSWRPASQRSKGFFINFFPESNYYSNALTEIIASFGWKSFVVIYEHDDTLSKLQKILQFQKYNENDKRNKIMFEKLGHGPDHSQLFDKIQRSTQTNIILDCRTDIIVPILRQAKQANLLNVYNNYFLMNLDSLTVDYSELNTTANITTIRLFDDNDNGYREQVRKLGLAELIHHKKLKTDTALFNDALWYLNDTIRSLPLIPYTNRIFCNGSQKFEKGSEISLTLKNQLSPDRLTGPIQFDDEGNRIFFNLHVVDVLHSKKIATWFEKNESLIVNAEVDESITVVTNLQSTKVIVSSRLGEPYLMLEEPQEGEELTGNVRYKGYSLDLIAHIAKIVGFVFEIVITEDGSYGHYDENLDVWTGVIGDILEKRAHLAICDLTITQERQEVVDFSLPFMELGISILYRTPDYGGTETFAFLDPFSRSVWMTILYSYIIVSVCLYIILRLSPDDWEKKHPCDELEETLSNQWSLKNSLLLTFKALTMQCSDAVPKGKSARLAICMWWLFCLIITSSYIANLALMVSQNNQETGINSAEDLASQTKVKYGMIAGGSTESFFKTSNNSIYQKMYSTIEDLPSVLTKTNREGVERVLEENGMYAFLMESTSLEYEIERNCELMQVGELLDTKGYGIAMPQNAPYRSAINRALLKLEEDGTLADLKQKWWAGEAEEDEGEKSCENTTPSGKLSLENVKGLFIILAIGIFVAFGVAIFEFLWNVKQIAREESITYCGALCDELKVVCSVWTNRRKHRN